MTTTEATAPATTTAAAGKAKRAKAPAFRVTALNEWDAYRQKMTDAQKRVVEATAKYHAAVKELAAAKAALVAVDAARPWRS